MERVIGLIWSTGSSCQVVHCNVTVIFMVDLQQYPTLFYNNWKILLDIHPTHVKLNQSFHNCSR